MTLKYYIYKKGDCLSYLSTNTVIPYYTQKVCDNLQTKAWNYEQQSNTIHSLPKGGIYLASFKSV
jgi:hypothetical protein